MTKCVKIKGLILLIAVIAHGSPIKYKLTSPDGIHQTNQRVSSLIAQDSRLQMEKNAHRVKEHPSENEVRELLGGVKKFIDIEVKDLSGNKSKNAYVSKKMNLFNHVHILEGLIKTDFKRVLQNHIKSDIIENLTRNKQIPSLEKSNAPENLKNPSRYQMKEFLGKLSKENSVNNIFGEFALEEIQEDGKSSYELDPTNRYKLSPFEKFDDESYFFTLTDTLDEGSYPVSLTETVDDESYPFFLPDKFDDESLAFSLTDKLDDESSKLSLTDKLDDESSEFSLTDNLVDESYKFAMTEKSYKLSPTDKSYKLSPTDKLDDELHKLSLTEKLDVKDRLLTSRKNENRSNGDLYKDYVQIVKDPAHIISGAFTSTDKTKSPNVYEPVTFNDLIKYIAEIGDSEDFEKHSRKEDLLKIHLSESEDGKLGKLNLDEVYGEEIDNLEQYALTERDFKMLLVSLLAQMKACQIPVDDADVSQCVRAKQLSIKLQNDPYYNKVIPKKSDSASTRSFFIKIYDEVLEYLKVYGSKHLFEFGKFY